MKYRPGPWVIEAPKEPFAAGDGYRISSPEMMSDRWRGYVTNVLANSPHAEANARLIAAAPDMLAALKALVADIQDYEKVNNLSPSPGKRDCWQSVTRAKAVIAQAENHNGD